MKSMRRDSLLTATFSSKTSRTPMTKESCIKLLRIAVKSCPARYAYLLCKIIIVVLKCRENYKELTNSIYSSRSTKEHTKMEPSLRSSVTSSSTRKTPLRRQLRNSIIKNWMRMMTLRFDLFIYFFSIKLTEFIYID